MTLMERVGAILEEIRVEFCPDPRLSVFEVMADASDTTLVLVGAVSEARAAEMLHRRLAMLDVPLAVEDRIVRLPDTSDGARTHALVTAATAPMQASPLVSDGNVSQSVLGHRLLVLRERGRWLHCRSEDGYLGWVHRGYVHRVDETTARAWEIGVEGEPCISLGAELLGDGGEVVARLPWGSRFLRRADGIATLPDGHTGRAIGKWVGAAGRAERFPPTAAAVLETAARWIGAPYLWGGITPAGVDCSGLAQAVYRLHGIQLPRDSDQQARVGEPVEPGPDFSGVLPGDLLFFAEEPGRISHVTLSLGGARILHASLGNGGVRRNDLLGPLPFEQELRRLFVTARRVLPAAR